MQSTLPQLIPMNLIDTAPQVRRSMNKDALQELAEDIKARGLLQPIMVRRTGERFRAIAGHRRRFACELNGMEQIPAMVMDTELDQDAELQLVENLQREDLNDDDLGLALSDLYEKHASLDTVALMVNKSKSWVSKHIKLATRLHYSARHLFEEGVTEDGDFLCALSDLLDLVDWRQGEEICKQVKAGKMDREGVRTILADLKAQREKEAQPKKGGKPAGEKKPRPRSINALAGDLQWPHDKTAHEIFASWSEKEQASFLDAVLVAWHQGADLKDDPIELAHAAATYEKPAFNLARWMGYLTDDEGEFLIDEYLHNATKRFASEKPDQDSGEEVEE